MQSRILLVHGAWHGPWCWDEFAEHLRHHGHEVHAVQLRGHDGPPGRIWHRVHHYLEDLQRAVAQFAQPPVLVGHSVGGLLVQKYLERDPAPGAVLMASIPTTGMIRPVARAAARHPLLFAKMNFLLSLRPFTRTLELVRELFFTPETPQDVVDSCHARLQDESYLMFVDLVLFTRPRPRRVETLLLVLGAERDWLFTEEEVRRTAAAYLTDAEIFPGMGHDMMLDQGWQQVADRVEAFARETTFRFASSAARNAQGQHPRTHTRT